MINEVVDNYQTSFQGDSYIHWINDLLQPKIKPKLPVVVDLFAGCGGLSLGFEAQGFPTIGFENNTDAASTYSSNLQGECHCLTLTETTQLPSFKILIGGPPCQPFSVGGKQKGLGDKRDGFPIFTKAVECHQPDIFLIENVRGLLYKSKPYLEEIVKRLQSLNYLVEFKLLNAVNYGTPQRRERVFIIGHRGKFSFPAQRSKQITAGEALGELAFSIPENSKFLTPSMDKYIAKYEKASQCIQPRDLHLDKPARTVTCRNLAGATGDMQRLKLPDGRRRRLTFREGARLQSFPDWFTFTGHEPSIFNQIGNAVPPMLAYFLAQSCREYLENNFRYSVEEIKSKNQIMNQGTEYQQLSLF
jgi:DNA (cytosine-5)-methyltransferase 1